MPQLPRSAINISDESSQGLLCLAHHVCLDERVLAPKKEMTEKLVNLNQKVGRKVTTPNCITQFLSFFARGLQ